ncbi:E3 ubiquitin-protein ligase RMND5A-like isoform X2 [Halichondria panicea]|uniref:E3 ubiquitin-protein ligase RMND5A-like isoform X2 n=1 Tax=Halichondria panicea TaxID=6063 RepID=UPI00312B6AC9
MDACLAVEREQEKVLKKLKTLSGSYAYKLQILIDQIAQLREELGSSEGIVDTSQLHTVKELVRKTKETCQSISTEHKDIHASISKFGKAIDKSLQADISGLGVEGVLSDESHSRELDAAICEHLFRQGRLDIGEMIIEDSGISVDPVYMEQFAGLNRVLEALRDRNMEPALEWALIHKDQLQHHGSCLEFKLRQLKFIDLLTSGQTREALAYAKVLGQFVPRHTKEIKRLMGCFLFANRGLEMSPYSDLLDPWHWTDVADIFARDACKLLGLSLESPLGVSLSVGCSALPQLLRLRSVMVQRQVSDMWTRDELPCEVSLGWDRRYHSVFTCPILRQQTTDANPPVRLVCGHSISKDAMKKLVSHSRRLKCPYCPREMTETEVEKIKF